MQHLAVVWCKNLTTVGCCALARATLLVLGSIREGQGKGKVYPNAQINGKRLVMTVVTVSDTQDLYGK